MSNLVAIFAFNHGAIKKNITLLFAIHKKLNFSFLVEGLEFVVGRVISICADLAKPRHVFSKIIYRIVVSNVGSGLRCSKEALTALYFGQRAMRT